MVKIKDIHGERFGKLIAVKVFGKIGSRIHWLCKCDCGNEKLVASNNIGRTTFSCGCEKIKRFKENNYQKSHGLYGTRTYKSWNSMHNRCFMKSGKDYHRYGGRGIKICERWMKFENFYADMGERPNGKSIDRIDVDGNYEPSNCRWATAKEQSNNRRKKNATTISTKSS